MLTNLIKVSKRVDWSPYFANFPELHEECAILTTLADLPGHLVVQRLGKRDYLVSCLDFADRNGWTFAAPIAHSTAVWTLKHGFVSTKATCPAFEPVGWQRYVVLRRRIKRLKRKLAVLKRRSYRLLHNLGGPGNARGSRSARILVGIQRHAR